MSGPQHGSGNPLRQAALQMRAGRDVSGGLAAMLPQMIDRLSPHGQLPDNHRLLQDARSAFLKR